MVENDPEPVEQGEEKESKPEELSEEERAQQFELMKSALSRAS